MRSIKVRPRQDPYPDGRDTGEVSVGDFWAAIAPHPPQPVQKSASRAGRNMPVAIVTACALLSVVALSLAFNPIWFTLLALIAFSIGLWEATGAFLAKDIHIPLTPMLVGIVLVVVATYTGGIHGGFVLFSFTSFIVAIWRLFVPRPHAVRAAITGVFVYSWIAFSGVFAIAMSDLPNGSWCIATLILLPAASDTGGLALGIAAGKHPIAPSISPKKSWEGFAGSVLFSALGSWLLIYLVLDMSWLWVVVFSIVTPVLATMGDFSESLLKRELGIKDMGTIFPGHGGMLDRIDAMLFCAPFFYLLYALAYGVTL